MNHGSRARLRSTRVDICLTSIVRSKHVVSTKNFTSYISMPLTFPNWWAFRHPIRQLHMLQQFSVPSEQRYVFELAQILGISVRLVSHRRTTSTCQEKASLLGWPFERVVKALYVKHKHHVVGIVTPETGNGVNLKELLSTVSGG